MYLTKLLWERHIITYFAILFVSMGIFLLFTIPVSSQSVGDLLVSPTRIVFEEGDRATTITLVNTGPETATYRISFIQMRMSEDGSMKEIQEPEPGEMFADQLIMFSPRQVVLPPGIPQIVRLQVRKPSDLDTGEYRSHLLFRAVPSDPEPLDETDDLETDFAIQFVPIYGVSIPVIVRHGSTNATVDISSLSLTPQTEDNPTPALSVEFIREGNRSVYGNITATFITDQGQEHVVGRRNGVAVYSPNSVRWVNINLNLPPDIEFENGTLHVTYRQADETGSDFLAEAEIIVP